MDLTFRFWFGGIVGQKLLETIVKGLAQIVATR